jgi:hypothetical protein
LDVTFFTGSGFDAWVHSIVPHTDGKILVGGNFTTYDGIAGNGVARLIPCIDVTGVDTQVSCGSYIWIDGVEYFESNDTATFTIVGGAASGCDSIVTLNLLINDVDNTVFVNGNTLTANQTGATYQWIDCNNNNTHIAGATNQSFIPSVSGNYAVVISANSCTETSVCVPCTIEITTNPIEIIPVPDLTICHNQGDCRSFQSIPNNPQTVFNWVAISSNQNNLVPPSGTGHFCVSNWYNHLSVDTIEVIVTPCLNGSCGTPDTFFVYLMPPIIEPIPDLVYCAGDTVSSMHLSSYLNFTTHSNWNYLGYRLYDINGNNLSGNNFLNSNDFQSNGIDSLPNFIATNDLSNTIKIHSFEIYTDNPLSCAYQDTTSFRWFSIIINPRPNVSAGLDQTICEGNSTVLSGSGAMTFNWSNAISDGIPFIPTSTNSYVVVGIDSVFGCNNSDTVVVTVVPASYSSEEVTACDSYTWNGNTYTTSGIYTSHHTNINGCDSIVSLNLTLNMSPTTPIITITNDTILSVSHQNGMQYQWLNCDTWLPLPNQTDTLLHTSESGNYAVIVSNSCGSDTSICVINTNATSELKEYSFQVYPNPTSDKAYLEVLANLLGRVYQITDFTGKLIQSGIIKETNQEINLKDVSTGVYFISIENQAKKVKINKL